jgi:hypothetical protein
MESGAGRPGLALVARLRSLMTLAGVFAVVMLVVAAADAVAAPPAQLTRFPEDEAPGTGANQFQALAGLATWSVDGFVYASDSGANRIDVFTPWGEFVESWGWGVENGSPETQTCGPAEPEPEPSRTLCRVGLAGSGPGQISGPSGIAVAPDGDIYVFERGDARIEKFDSAGNFVLMFGGSVNKTTGGDVCTAASGDECGAGVEGTGDGSFTLANSPLDSLAVSASGTVYYADGGRIQEFDSEGHFQSSIPLPQTGDAGPLEFDPASGDLYYGQAFDVEPRNEIYKLDPSSGAILDTLVPQIPGDPASPAQTYRIGGLTTDVAGDVYAALNGSGLVDRVVAFDSSGNALIDYASEFAGRRAKLGTNSIGSVAANSVGDLYVSESNGVASESTASVAVYGPPPTSLGPPPTVPPNITDQFAANVGTVTARVAATINPRFFDDTRYSVEYGVESCAVAACKSEPPAPGVLLTTAVVNAPLRTQGMELTGLEPGTEYHYRFVAVSSGGGPVTGLSGQAGAAAEGTFTTQAEPGSQPACPANEAFRFGFASTLPDCRAYEMVSPVDKANGDISVILNSSGLPTGFEQTSTDGEKLTYSSFRAFGDSVGSPYTSQYLASRGPEGWTSQAISPPRGTNFVYSGGPLLDSQYKGFTPDLCDGWLLQDTNEPLAAGFFPGAPNLYKRDLCGGGYEQLAPRSAPEVSKLDDYRPQLVGTSVDGSKAFFIAIGKLTSDASNASQLYEATGSELKLVCILPNKTPSAAPCTAGVPANGGALPDRGTMVSHAISDDGAVVYWTELGSETSGGKLYVRVAGTKTILVNGSSSRFWGGSPDGSKAIYASGPGLDELFEFNLASKESTQIAQGLVGVLGVSEDASRVYFVSKEVIAGSGANSVGREAVAGAPNVYLYEKGEPASYRFVATLSSADINADEPLSPIATAPNEHTSQVSDNGAAVTFMSTARATGFNNTDATSGRADAEVFLYHADTGSLVCVSCLASGARPSGQNLESSRQVERPFWAAAQIPVAENQTHIPRVLSGDGSRLFFESFDGLAPGDSNGQQDVYEWEALGAGNCAEGVAGFSAKLGGCVSLISSGVSTQRSEIVDSTASGRDVFFKTASSLLPQDPGLIDIYDAREGGGFPIPPTPGPECEGEGCQPSPPSPPASPTAASASPGLGNPKVKKPQPSCGKGKHRVSKKGKTQCVKKTKKHKHHHKNKGKPSKKKGSKTKSKGSNKNRRVVR